MNWDAVGAVGEIVGASAVVVSLLYLAIQIKSQNRESRSAAMHDILVGFRDTVADFGGPEVADLYVRGMKSIDSFTDAEMFQMNTGAQRFFRLWEEAFYLHSQGRLEGENWDGMNRQLASFWSTAGFQHVWSIRQQYYGKEFVKMVNSLDNPTYKIR